MERKRIGLAAVILVLLVMGQAAISLAESSNSMIKEISYQQFNENPASETVVNKVVYSKDLWTDTGIALKSGSMISVAATGKWRARGPLPYCGPKGYGNGPWNLGRVDSSCRMGSLIGRIGNHESFCISEKRVFQVEVDGLLYLSINDAYGAQGSMSIEIQIKQSSISSMSNASSLSKTSINKEVKTPLAIFDIHSINISYDDSQVLTSYLRSQMAQTNLYTIVERQYIQRILKEQGLQQLDIVNQDTAVHLGKLVGARKILLGEVGQIGQTYTLTLRLVDVETGQVDKTASKACKCAKDDLVNVISELAGQLGK